MHDEKLNESLDVEMKIPIVKVVPEEAKMSPKEDIVNSK